MEINSGKGRGSFDVSRIIRQILNIRQVNELFTRLPSICRTQGGMTFLRSAYLQIPEQVRPNETAFRNLPNTFLTAYQQLKDPSNPIIRQIESWFADADELLKMAIDVLHGALLGLINNGACNEFGPLDLTEMFKEISKAHQVFEASCHQWLFETATGRDIYKTIAMELLSPIRPNDGHYQNILTIAGVNLIHAKERSHPPFKPMERMFAEDKELLTLFVKAYMSRLVWSINTGNNINMCLGVLRILNEINEKYGYPVSRRWFWLQGLESSSHLRRDLIQYANNKNSESNTSQAFTWLDAPFLLNVRTKWKFVSLEAVLTMERDMLNADKENSIRRQINKTIYAKWFPQARVPIIPTSLQFHVDRDNIVQTAIDNVDKYWNEDEDSVCETIWLKPLGVNFERESAIDLGGPSKDFFHHLFSALLDPHMPMFRNIDDQATSSHVWFNEHYFHYKTLEKIGLLFALAIYNGAVTTVPFPEQLYEKLLSDRDPDVSDLGKMDQDFAKQLYMLRELKEEDVNALELDFTGLRPEGDTINVSKDNLEEYISGMVNKKLAIPQLTAFAKGFNRIASKTPLMRSIFKAEDLRDVVLGEELDWNAFKFSAMYQFPYVPDHPVIMMFWKVFGELEEREKRQFLKFLTGADHVPVGGFVPFPIRRLNNMANKYRNPVHPDKFPEPGQLMPEVMTCRGYLSMDLPEYESEEDLSFRLKLAIQTSGFHREGQHASSATAPCSQSPMLRQVVHVGVHLLMGGSR
nr:probable E3 ubiquitin-protein ligase HERC4 [Lytechinus pictus]